MNRHCQAQGARGLTLIELLVVIAIIGILGGALALGIPRMLRAGETSAVENLLQTIAVSLEAYAQNPSNGDYPPTSLDGMPGVGRLKNLENCGIEAAVLCLNRAGTSNAMDFDNLKVLTLENLDGDFTLTGLSTFGPENKHLYELVDPWQTPLVYFHSRDYDVVEVQGLGVVSGIDGPVSARPWRNPKTGTYYRHRDFQLISAGPDGRFNTDDDITNFDRN